MPSSFPLVRVVGMHFRGQHAKDYAATLQPGDELLLEREPDNKFDSNAVKVLTPGEHGFHLGYIEKGAASYIAPELDEGFSFSAAVVDVIEDRNNLYPRINITPADVEA